MRKRNMTWLPTLFLAGAMSIASAGCVLDEEAELDEEADIGELEQSIQVGEVNGVCAQNLWLRTEPAGTAFCSMNHRDHVFVHRVDGGWADVTVRNGPCDGHRGWADKDWLSRNCN